MSSAPRVGGTPGSGWHPIPPIPAFLSSYGRSGSEATNDQSFYTPAEQPEERYFHDDAEDESYAAAATNEMPAATPTHALTTPSQTAEPTPVSPRIARKPVGASYPPRKDVSNGGDSPTDPFL